MMNDKRFPNIVLSFGKYEGRSVAAVAKCDLRYLTWLASLPVVRGNPALWASVRGHLLEQLQREVETELIAELG